MAADDAGGGGFGGEPSPEADALQKAIESKASNSEMKAALAKYQESRKTKQADLETAQVNLKKVFERSAGSDSDRSGTLIIRLSLQHATFGLTICLRPAA